MIGTKSLRSVSLVVLLLASLLGVAPVDPASAVGGGWLDTSNRNAVIAAYNAEFSKVTPAIGWTGNRAGCSAGTTSQAYRTAVVDRINYFRAMAGVPTGVTENQAWSAEAQQAALSMSVSGKLSHSPDASFSCLNATVTASAGKSNLYLGRTGPEAITGYVEDPGSNNVSAGHRSWIFHSTLTQVGVGDIPATGGWSANTLQVIDSNTAFATQPALRESSGFVAWPARGYNPGQLVFPRWSFTLRGATFSQASVSVTKNGQAVGNSVVHRSSNANGAPFPSIVWEPTGVNTAPLVDETYSVTVSNVSIGGQLRSYSYDVIIIGQTAASAVAPTDHQRFITSSYQDFLGRTPNESEIAYWNGQLNSGVSRTTFINTLASSSEWVSFIVDDLYTDTLGRGADAAGRQYWVQRIQGGASVAAVAAAFYGSPEYVTRKGGTYDRWVADLYGVLLSRSADQSGLTFWTGQASQIGSQSVALEFYQSEESRRARVTALYRTLLDRDPDPAGLVYWAGVLRSGNDLALAGFLAGSDEYYARS